MNTRSNTASSLASAPGSAAPAPEASRLKRAITGPLLFLFILGDVLGAGVYALVGKIAGEVGGALWAPLLLALACAAATAASYAELVTKYPRAGGAAVFVGRAFGKPWLAFLVGMAMLAAGVTSAAGLALAFGGDYLGAFVQVPPLGAALVFLLAVALLNARGISESLHVNLVLTLVELSGLVLVVVLAFMFMSNGGGEPARWGEFKSGVSPTSAILGAALLAFYSFVGFEVSANVAEETRDVHRLYPRALFGALATAGALYVAVGLAASLVLPPDVLARSSAPLLDVVRATGYAVPERLFAAVALVAVANGALLTMIMASRLAYGMAEEGLLPAVLTRVLPKRRTPWVAIVVTTVIAVLLAATGTLALLAETVVLLLLFVFIASNAAVLKLKREEVDHEHFRTPRFLPWVAIATCVVLLFQQNADAWLRAAVTLGVGALAWVLVGGLRRRSGRPAA